MKIKVQSVLMPKDMKQETRENWLSDHNFKIKFGKKPVHETDNFFRYRQFNPKYGDDIEYRTKKLEDGVELVYYIQDAQVKYKKKGVKKTQTVASTPEQ